MTFMVWVKNISMLVTTNAICWGKIATSYFYSELVSSIIIMSPICTPPTPRHRHRHRKRRQRHIRHYGLRQKVLSRSSPRPPKLPTVLVSPLSRLFTFGCGLFPSFSSLLQPIISWSQGTTASSSTSSDHSTSTTRRSKFQKDQHLQPCFEVQQDHNPSDNVFGKSFIRDLKDSDIHNFCHQMDFIHLHQLASLFFPTSSFESTTTSI
jgi:hypothetical protein